MDEELRAAERARDVERVRALRQRAGLTRAEDVPAIDALIDAMAADPGCKVMPPAGLPVVEPSHRLPADMARFYERCGGATISRGGGWEWQLLPPSQVVLANPLLVGERCEYDRSSEWFVVVGDSNGDYITIDLDPGRLGRCYDSYMGCHANRGGCSIVARSFTDLVGRLLADRDGCQPYWSRPGFESLGDAYD